MANRGADRADGRRTLPVNLLLKGRLCLFVGAGHVAHRKCRGLLDHGARVVLAAPDPGPGVRELAADGRVEVRKEGYRSELLDELSPFLTFAATDDDDLNARIAADARARGLLASSVSCWEQGDFISPSRIPWGRGQVSISTEGASCRQAKFMRLRLTDLLGGERDLMLLGVDLRSLSLEEFGRLRPDAAKVCELSAMLMHLAALEEFTVLATCNRLELYAFARPEESLLGTVRRILGLEEFADRVYVLTGDAVTEHAANVVAGHLSEVVCETQVTGQFKSAFQAAFAAHAAGVHLQNLHDTALAMGKKLRRLHEAGRAGLPELVADLVRSRFPPSERRVLLLGAGGLGREVAEALGGVHGVRLTWANRTLGHIPPEAAARRLSLPEALGELGDHDVVVSVLAVREPAVRSEHLRDGSPLLIDLGLPRNVQAGVPAEVLDLGHFRGHGPERERLLTLAHAVAAGSGANDG